MLWVCVVLYVVKSIIVDASGVCVSCVLRVIGVFGCCVCCRVSVVVLYLSFILYFVVLDATIISRFMSWNVG